MTSYSFLEPEPSWVCGQGRPRTHQMRTIPPHALRLLQKPAANRIKVFRTERASQQCFVHCGFPDSFPANAD
jgi:hypothetical protein